MVGYIRRIVSSRLAWIKLKHSAHVVSKVPKNHSIFPNGSVQAVGIPSKALTLWKIFSYNRIAHMIILINRATLTINKGR